MTSPSLALINALTLGVFSGSLLTEAFVLVPFWQSMQPDEFFAKHHDFGSRLFRYFAPLTIAAAALPVALAVWEGGTNVSANIAACASLITLAFFPLYFRKANNDFFERRISNEDLPKHLKTWARVHATRTFVALMAFGAGLYAI